MRRYCRAIVSRPAPFLLLIGLLVAASACGDPVTGSDAPDVPTVSDASQTGTVEPDPNAGPDPVDTAAVEPTVAPTVASDPPVVTEPASAETTEPLPPSPATTVASPTTAPVPVSPPQPTPTNAFDISVSSELPPSPVGDTYGPDNLVDGDLTTAWNHCGSECGGFADDDARNGVDQSIVIRFAEPTVLTGFSIANGYQKRDPVTFFRNNRVDRLRVEFDDGSSIAIQLDDDRGVQEDFFEPRTVTVVTLAVESVFLGDGTFNDLALSEIAAWILPA